MYVSNNMRKGHTYGITFDRGFKNGEIVEVLADI